MKQRTVLAIYTGSALVASLKAVAAEILPSIRLISLLDDSLIADIIRAGKMSPTVLGRINSDWRGFG